MLPGKVPLTPTQFRELAQRLTFAEIAQQQGISPCTVTRYARQYGITSKRGNTDPMIWQKASRSSLAARAEMIAFTPDPPEVSPAKAMAGVRYEDELVRQGRPEAALAAGRRLPRLYGIEVAMTCSADLCVERREGGCE